MSTISLVQGHSRLRANSKWNLHYNSTANTNTGQRTYSMLPRTGADSNPAITGISQTGERGRKLRLPVEQQMAIRKLRLARYNWK